jgi:hypothetical protein
MDLEAESPLVLNHWLRAIHKIKKKAGKKVVKDDVLPVDIAGPRRFDDLLPSQLLAQLAYFEDQTEQEHLAEFNRCERSCVCVCMYECGCSTATLCIRVPVILV